VFGDVAEVRTNRHFRAVGAEGKGNWIGRIVRDEKRINFDIADAEVAATYDFLDTLQALLESFGERALQSVQRRFGYVQRRRFPDAEHLRETVAMVGVLVGDEDGVETAEFPANGGQAGESFAFTETGVDEDSSALSLKQREVAGAAGRQDGNAQGD